MASPPAGGQSSRLPHRRTTLIAMFCGIAVLAAAAMIWRHRHFGGADAHRYQNRVVAVVELQSRAQNAQDKWLSPALMEMLGTELSAADEIRVIPEATVLVASAGMKARGTGGYDPEPLAQLRQRLNVDFVVSGRYRLTDSPGDDPLSMVIDLQDARTGASIATVSKQGSLSSLNLLVNQAGAELRQKLGVSNTSRGRLNQIASVQPPTTAVAQRIGFALDAIARHDSARARDELLEAVEEAPDYAPSYLYLSQAWAALGYRQKALAAAKQAVSHSSSAPAELRIQIEAAVQTDNYDAKHAADSWRTLVALRPLTLEYRLQLISAEIDAGDPAAAEIALADLRNLPQASQDPRAELAATQLARARSDPQSQAQHAQEALRLAQIRQTPGLVADAQVALADAQTHLGQLESAKGELDESIAGYHQMENPSGEVSARRLRAAVLETQMHHQEALEEYQRAIALAETIGDAGDVGTIYRNISSMLWMQGDREGTQASARRALEIGRTTGDLRLQSWTLRALATIASDDAATDEVLSEYREVTALTESSHDLGGQVWSLATYADTLRMRGQLDEAQAGCVKAEAEANALSDPQFRIYTDSICASLAMDRGEQDTALLLLEKLELLSRSSGNTVYEGNSEFLTGQIEFDAGHYAKSQEHLRRALELYTSAKADTGEANVEALLALCAQMLKEPVERDRAASHARVLRAAISSQQEIYLVDIALARLGGPEQRSAAVDRLRKIAGDAEHRHWIAWSLEAKLAEWQILTGLGNASEASETRADVEKTARALGFKRILSLLNTSRTAQ
jgi:tetratricopeptide (TPR) repeat protein/TolB-like protein